MSDPVIETSNLTREFAGDIRAVDGVDLRVGAGEIFGFLGPNGAGKSTTVRILTTLLRPSSGSARVAGFDVAEQPDAVRRRIGVALQDAAIDPYMTGRELLRLQGVLHRLPRPEARSRGEQLLERVDLVDAGDRRVATYSGGMRRRLDLALALIHEPSVLFLDEPTTGLDPPSRQTLWAEVRRLNAEQETTVFLTTQYLEEVDALADHLAIIDNGRLVAAGTPGALKAEVGDPTLTVTVESPDALGAAAATLAGFGPAVEPPDDRSAAIRLAGGAARMSDVVRALDQSGVVTAGLELSQPSLDDVFMAKTGRHLESDPVGGE